MKIPDDKNIAELSCHFSNLEIGGVEMFALLACVQLASRHPGVQDNGILKVAKFVARKLERAIGEAVPDFKDVMAAGWNPDYDGLTDIH